MHRAPNLVMVIQIKIPLLREVLWKPQRHTEFWDFTSFLPASLVLPQPSPEGRDTSLAALLPGVGTVINACSICQGAKSIFQTSKQTQKNPTGLAMLSAETPPSLRTRVQQQG